MYNKVDTNLNFVQREAEVLKFWKENSVFEKSVNNIIIHRPQKSRDTRSQARIPVFRDRSRLLFTGGTGIMRDILSKELFSDE